MVLQKNSRTGNAADIAMHFVKKEPRPSDREEGVLSLFYIPIRRMIGFLHFQDSTSASSAVCAFDTEFARME